MHDRKTARASWPVRLVRQDEPDSEDLSSTTTPEERLAMMWPLAVEAWTLAGREIPAYARHEAPVRIVRRGPS